MPAKFDVSAVDNFDLFGAKLAVDVDEFRGEIEGSERMQRGNGHSRSSAHDNLSQQRIKLTSLVIYCYLVS